MSTSSGYVDGSHEYLTVTVTSDVELGAQPVAISIDRGVTWLPATWQGSYGTTRKARTTDPVPLDVGGGSERQIPVLVKVTDTPEIPLMRAGHITIRTA